MLAMFRVIRSFIYSLLAQIPQYTSYLHRHCFRLLLGHVHVPGGIANNEYAKFWGVKEVHYGIVQVVNTNYLNVGQPKIIEI